MMIPLDVGLSIVSGQLLCPSGLDYLFQNIGILAGESDHGQVVKNYREILLKKYPKLNEVGWQLAVLSNHFLETPVEKHQQILRDWLEGMQAIVGAKYFEVEG